MECENERVSRKEEKKQRANQNRGFASSGRDYVEDTLYPILNSYSYARCATLCTSTTTQSSFSFLMFASLRTHRCCLSTEFTLVSPSRQQSTYIFFIVAESIRRVENPLRLILIIEIYIPSSPSNQDKKILFNLIMKTVSVFNLTLDGFQ